MKLRRDAITQYYAAEIDAMYVTARRTGRERADDAALAWDEDDVFRRVR